MKGKREVEEYPRNDKKYLVKEIYRSCLQCCCSKYWFHYFLGEVGVEHPTGR